MCVCCCLCIGYILLWDKSSAYWLTVNCHPAFKSNVIKDKFKVNSKKFMIAPKYDLLLWGDQLTCSARLLCSTKHACISTWNVFNTVTKTVKLYSWRGSLLLLMFHFTGIFYATATSQPAASPRLFKLPSSYLMSVDLILLSRNIGCVSHRV